MRDFAQAFTDLSIIVDEDGQLIEAFGNSGLLVKPDEKIIGLNIDQVFSKRYSRVLLNKIGQTIEDNSTREFILEFRFGDMNRLIGFKTAPMPYLVNGKKTAALAAVDVTKRKKTERILEFSYELRRRSDFINDLISGSIAPDKHALDNAKILGIDISFRFFCCLLSYKDIAELAAESQIKFTQSQIQKTEIISFLSDISDQIIVWDCFCDIGILYWIKDAEEPNDCCILVNELLSKIKEYKPNLAITAGISEIHAGLDSIKKSYQQAWSSIIAARCREDVGEQVLHFRDLGIFQILIGLNQEQTTEYFQEKIGKLIKYDMERGTNFLFTLENILHNNCNLKETAQKMYLHHKTLFFRKRRIETILGVSIEPFETKLALSVAIMLYKINKKLNT